MANLATVYLLPQCLGRPCYRRNWRPETLPPSAPPPSPSTITFTTITAWRFFHSCCLRCWRGLDFTTTFFVLGYSCAFGRLAFLFNFLLNSSSLCLFYSLLFFTCDSLVDFIVSLLFFLSFSFIFLQLYVAAGSFRPFIFSLYSRVCILLAHRHEM